ncbi:MAG TPA: hypothetical protein VHD88_05890 [Pyrinomonadaceae bacterium]|nr:hypothetical protein [Pyrinomonadaceae bacterium]
MAPTGNEGYNETATRYALKIGGCLLVNAFCALQTVQLGLEFIYALRMLDALGYNAYWLAAYTPEIHSVYVRYPVATRWN